MNCCLSSEDEKKDKEVTYDLHQDAKTDKQIKKLLFLGSGGSGKSTLFKQLRTIHGGGFEDKDRMGFKNHIYSQIIEQMKLLIEKFNDLTSEFPEQFGHLKLSQEGIQAARFIQDVRGDMDVNKEIATNIEILWRETAIREIFEHRAKLKIDDSSKFFFNEIFRIATQNYMPTDQDILLVRHRTTGVIEQKFSINGTHFHVFDVGGQRSERKKWIHCFEHVTAVIFVASLSAYDEIMFEDENANAMEDSLKLFHEICNLRWFTSTAMILLLNKQDIFAEKIQKTPITVCFPSYNGANNYEAYVDYIRQQFEKQNNNGTRIYTHMTCAVDRNLVEKLFNDVQHIVIDYSLTRGGLL